MVAILKYFLEGKFKKGLVLIVLITLLTVVAVSMIWQSQKNLLGKKQNQNNSEAILSQQDTLKDKSDGERVLPTPKTSSPSPASPSTLVSSPTPVATPQNNYASPTYTSTKQNFSPTFSVLLENPTPSTPSEVNIEYGSNTGYWLGMGIKIVIPPGWDVVSGSQLGQDVKVGEGLINAKLDGEPSSSRFTVYNKTDTLNHKAKWLFKFDNEIYGERTFFVDGDKDHGHLLFLDGTVGLPFSSPVSGKLTIFSNIITNPPSPGIFEWKIQYLFADGILEVKKDVTVK